MIELRLKCSKRAHIDILDDYQPTTKTLQYRYIESYGGLPDRPEVQWSGWQDVPEVVE